MQTFKEWDALHLGWQTAEDIWNESYVSVRQVRQANPARAQ